MLLRWGLAIVLVIHGLGHVMFAMAAWTNIDVGFTANPWILPGNVMADSLLGKASAIIWLLAMLGFLAAALGLVTQAGWWPGVAVGAAALSLIVLLLWWQTVTPDSRLWAALVDVVIVVALAGPWRDRVLGIIAQ